MQHPPIRPRRGMEGTCMDRDSIVPSRTYVGLSTARLPQKEVLPQLNRQE